MRLRREDREELTGENLRLRSEVKRLTAAYEDLSHEASEKIDWLLSENDRLQDEASRWRQAATWWESVAHLQQEAREA